ncbi:bifunctional hydroxymethylpyrimidine kinase/phosphomethylpyrimidine kinase [Marinilabilia rubra]|uniref:hydroxymethylpyrimidine kinase n=1 Tax=Marinilabilia rubra TaxID=2162893 RepID=A0A2U2BAL9_9BACT|nr:bifunctional hydroxymethylpyrimidine kinase/phosphomethylpyrimidine kinase [Marinilabilia rubra]PWE00110.1 bifunctional hydroxymethylpyrimidine kinase/phosphomethylpyrimidine kinase [Marinilabilia rubra]
MKKYNTTLTIAGSDSGGGAGIQADLKTFSACGCYGMSVITAITAQNTQGVSDIYPVQISTIDKQLDAVLSDIGADAVKIGMLHSSEVINLVAEKIKEYNIKNLVIDPVMAATSGDKLLQDEAIAALKNELLPLAAIITPNIPEASILLGREIHSQLDLPEVAKQLSFNQNVSVLLKAGHLTEDELVDVFYDAEKEEIIRLPSHRIKTLNTHGTGCTLSSAIAAHLSKGKNLQTAVKQGKEYIDQAIKAGRDYQIGHGHGPVHHFHNWWN